MWNYRVVRKKNAYHDPLSQEERICFTYGIHEAFYDENGFVWAITKDPIEPFGDNIEELRHSWVMMAEAFGQPILDYDKIPEPGYERDKDPVGSNLDKGCEDSEEDLEIKCGPFDEEAYQKQREEERLEKEEIHNKNFVGTPSLKELIEKIYTEYREHADRDVVHNA